MNIIKKDSLVMTCSACPSQWEGKTKTGKDVYIRLRHGSFRIDINGKTVLRGCPNGFDGVMDTEKMISYVNTKFKKTSIR